MHKRLALVAMPVMFAGQMLCAQLAKADTVSILGFNISSMSIQGHTASGLGFTGIHDTGDLSLSATLSTSVDIAIDGVKQETLASRGPAGTATFNLMGDIQLSNGNITGGSIELMTRTGNESYSFDIAPGSGSLHKIPGLNSYLLAGLTYNGNFGASDFGGVDVGFWMSQQPVLGSFLQFNYNPNNSGLDRSANLDVAVFGESFSPVLNDVRPPAAVPLPSAAWGGMVLLTGFGMSRRRSRATIEA